MNSPHFHAVIWIDHHLARVFHFNANEEDHKTLHPHNAVLHIHHKVNTIGSGHETLDHVFLREVTAAVATAGAVLILGPGNAKTELMKHISRHDPKLKEKIKGVSAIDHPTDAQILAHARKFFKSEHQLQQR